MFLSASALLNAHKLKKNGIRINVGINFEKQEWQNFFNNLFY